MTDRVDNGIKLKRNKRVSQKSNRSSLEPESPQTPTKRFQSPLNPKLSDTRNKSNNSEARQLSTPRTDAFIVDPATTNKDQQGVIESLKKEWSLMFNKLEIDYQNKLNDQQKSNENRLKELHEEIKQSIHVQQQIIDQQGGTSPRVNLAQQRSESDDSHTGSLNSKYISNLRAELKNKHSRHVQDLTEYYEKELEEMQKKLKYYKEGKVMNNVIETSCDTDKIHEDESNKKQTFLNAELKNSNAVLLNKLVSFFQGQEMLICWNNFFETL